MNTKTFEIRDKNTFIPVMAVQLEPGCEADRYLLARAGYGRKPEEQKQYYLVATLITQWGWVDTEYDPFKWGGERTMNAAHHYIEKNWDSLESGAVVDVQFILGETAEPKVSEAMPQPELAAT